jgi:hypothetical protein
LRQKLDLYEEDLPIKWPDGGGPILRYPPLDLEAEAAKEERAKDLAEFRRQQRLADPHYVEPQAEPEVKPEPELPPEPKKALSVTPQKVKRPKTPGTVKALPEARKEPPEAPPEIQAPKPTTPPEAPPPVVRKVPPPEPKTPFHRSVINARKDGRRPRSVAEVAKRPSPQITPEAPPVEYISSSVKPVAPVAVVEAPPKEIPVVRTGFDVSHRRRRKRH